MRLTLLLGTLLTLLAATTPAYSSPAAPTRRYAVIVVNNNSPEPGLAPLSFADDDGARYFELFSALGAKVALLGVLDADAQHRFPEATAQARLPSWAELSRTLDTFFESMRADTKEGATTELYFVYSGHGTLGPNREGTLGLLDRRLGRSDLYRDVIARSPATYNHLILDACYAYFMVEKKGASAREGDYRDSVLGFLSSEELSSYPNTGVILATTDDAETHEWARWQAGVFSHELTSALLGAGDVDGNGAVTYAEAAAAVEAANSGIDDPRMRLRVHARPPAIRVDHPLVNLSEMKPAGWLELGRSFSGHSSIEDARGVRVADLNPSGEADVRLALVGQGPFFLRREGQGVEARLEPSEAGATLSSDALSFAPLAQAHKGVLEQSFRRALFSVGFGPSFYRGMLAMTGPGAAGWDGWYGSGPRAITPIRTVSERAPSRSYRSTLGYVSLGIAAGTAVGGVLFLRASEDTFTEYQRATVPSEAVRLKEKTQRETLAGNVLLGIGAATAVTGGALLLWHVLDPDEVSVVASAGPQSVGIGIAGRW